MHLSQLSPLYINLNFEFLCLPPPEDNFLSSPYGGSVKTKSTLLSGIVFIISRQSPKNSSLLGFSHIISLISSPPKLRIEEARPPANKKSEANFSPIYTPS